MNIITTLVIIFLLIQIGTISFFYFLYYKTVASNILLSKKIDILVDAVLLNNKGLLEIKKSTDEVSASFLPVDLLIPFSVGCFFVVFFILIFVNKSSSDNSAVAFDNLKFQIEESDVPIKLAIEKLESICTNINSNTSELIDINQQFINGVNNLPPGPFL